MSGEGGQTARDPSGWTPDLLKALLDDKFSAVRDRENDDRRTNRERFAFVCVVVALGWNEVQRRLLTLNHAHEQHEATLAATVTSDKYDSDKVATNLRIASIETKQTEAETRERTSSEVAAQAVGAARAAREESYGGRTEHRQSRAMLISGTGVAVALIALIITILALRHNTPTVVNPVVPMTVTETVPTSTAP